MFGDDHINACRTRQRIQNALLTNYQRHDPKIGKEDHIMLTGGGGTVYQRRVATGRCGRTFFDPAVKVLRKSFGKTLLTPEEVSEDFMLLVPPAVCAQDADAQVAFLYCREGVVNLTIVQSVSFSGDPSSSGGSFLGISSASVTRSTKTT
jgi:hypothetical protein